MNTNTNNQTQFNTTIHMPKNAKHIIDILKKNGYEAYIVGGCVRDAILAKEPNDWDITTSATPMQVKELFSHTVDTGIQHGTVTVIMKSDHITGNGYSKDLESYEVTTYRIDGKYEDHRRPTEVAFTTSLSEDLLRRDFTINAMAYNDDEGIIDLYHGIDDLKAGIIRCVGVPEHRFDEDALRILRAVRFAAQLDFVIDEATQDAIEKKKEFLKDISAERIQVELTKLLISSHPERLMDAYHLGITAIVLPEFDEMMMVAQNNPHHQYCVGEHALKAVCDIKPTPVYRWGALLHDIGKTVTKTTTPDGIDHFYGHPAEGVPLAKAVLRRMKLDNHTINRVLKIVEWHDYAMADYIKKSTLRKAINRFGGPSDFPDIFEIRYADIKAQSMLDRDEKFKKIAHMEQLFEEIISEKNCLSVKELAVNGGDLIAHGVTPGKEMGSILQNMLEDVLEYPEHNTVEYLLEHFIK